MMNQYMTQLVFPLKTEMDNKLVVLVMSVPGVKEKGSKTLIMREYDDRCVSILDYEVVSQLIIWL